jgi:hypothetical protein
LNAFSSKKGLRASLLLSFSSDIINFLLSGIGLRQTF